MRCVNAVLRIPTTNSTSHNVHYVKSMMGYPQIYGYVLRRFRVIHRNLWITVDKSLWTSRCRASLGPWPRPPPVAAEPGAAAAALDTYLHPPIRKKFLK
jgi:hypothetical protein